MENEPKPTPDFNRLIAESDYLISNIALIIQNRVNGLNTVKEDIENLDKFSNAKKNLKKTHGNRELKEDFLKNIKGKQPLFGGFNDEKVNKILYRYDSIVKKRNMIVHSLPCVVNNKYVKKYLDFDKKENTIIDEDFLKGFNKEAKDFIRIMENPDYAPIIDEVVRIKRSLKPILEDIEKKNQNLQRTLMHIMEKQNIQNIVIPNIIIEKTEIDTMFCQMKQLADNCMRQQKNIYPSEKANNVEVDTESKKIAQHKK